MSSFSGHPSAINGLPSATTLRTRHAGQTEVVTMHYFSTSITGLEFLVSIARGTTTQTVPRPSHPEHGQFIRYSGS